MKVSNNMKNKNRNKYIVSSIFFVLFVLFTFLVKTVDVKSVGPQGSDIGFSTVNKFVFDTLGQSSFWYAFSEGVGYIALLIAFAFAVTGFVQMLKRKSILKIDADIITLGVLYALTVCAYIFFEIVIINYRPILVEGVLEASYPSSHTMLALVIFGSTIMQIGCRIKNKPIKNILMLTMCMMIAATVFGRLASGLHWLTDVIGATILSAFFCRFIQLC